jgi:acetylornithine deacetylase/succinyl-diaminopimelate desuccinylase-like protein
MHVAAIRSLLDAYGSLPINLKVIIEGEEEIGSPNLERAVLANLDALRADVVVISDTAMFAPGQPALCYGLRGLAYFELAVEGANTDLHSGGFGGAVPNACQALADLLSGLKDSHGRITLAGFYDDVLPIGDLERSRLAALPHNDDAYRARLGLSDLAGEDGYGTLERVWTRPSLDINGIWGGYEGPGSKTVLPARAGAKLSFRLVPDQRPERVAELLEQDLRRRCPPGIKLSATMYPGSAAPWVTALDHPYMRAAGQALATAFGREPVFIRAGGSIPVVATFDRHLRVPVVLLGAAVPACNAHAPNEFFPLDSFTSGAHAAALLYANLTANVSP